MRWCFGLLLLASCQLVFSVEPPEPPAQPCIEVGVDTDLDGVDDGCDVCSEVADSEQRDVDLDGTGDACDNCPGLASSNLDDGDGDGIGDACDTCVETFNLDQRDTDGDLLGDACDPCPSSVSQDLHDEDDDGLPDVCDNCPHIPNVDQANSDADGIGNVCDNKPGTDCIALFDGLSTLDNWDLTVKRGSWVVAGDSLEQSISSQQQGYLPTTASFLDPIVITRATVQSVATTNHNVGVWSRTTPTTSSIDSGLLVEAVDVDNGEGGRLSVASCNAAGDCTPLEPTFPTTTTKAPVAAGATVIIGSDLREAPAFAHSLQVDGGVAFGAKTGLTNNVTARVGLRTSGASARFDYFLVIVRSFDGTCPPR